MALIPWRERSTWLDSFNELERIQEEMNRLFNFSLSRSGGHNRGLLEGAWGPAVDVYDSKDNVVVKAEIPGMNKDDIEVTVQGDTLVIKGEKKYEHDEKKNDHIRSERFYGAFHRGISLGSEVEADKVKAEYKNGVLQLTLPKKEGHKPKQIKVDVK
jgi:HSP20 family protein